MHMIPGGSNEKRPDPPDDGARTPRPRPGNEPVRPAGESVFRRLRSAGSDHCRLPMKTAKGGEVSQYHNLVWDLSSEDLKKLIHELEEKKTDPDEDEDENTKT